MCSGIYPNEFESKGFSVRVQIYLDLLRVIFLLP
jgi:hypothetical protein